MKPEYYVADHVQRLPPLILHPFSDNASPNKLVQSSRASLMLQGLLPNQEFSVEQLEKTIVEGRFCEVRMLYYVGRDVMRWVDQCMEVVTRDAELRRVQLQPPSFTTMLVCNAPAPIREKLTRWGVQDFASIFSRAVGLNAVFADLPEPHHITVEFLKNYHSYADRLYLAWSDLFSWQPIRPQDFPFELYASSEYSRMLAREWQESGDTASGF